MYTTSNAVASIWLNKAAQNTTQHPDLGSIDLGRDPPQTKPGGSMHRHMVQFARTTHSQRIAQVCGFQVYIAQYITVALSITVHLIFLRVKNHPHHELQ